MAFDPSTVALSDWRRAFAGAPWGPTASAGTSGIRGSLAELTTPCTVSSALNGFTGADCDGAGKLLTEDTYLVDQILSSTAWHVTLLIFARSAAAPLGGNGYVDPAIVGERTQGYWYVAYTTNGVTVGHYDSLLGVWVETTQSCPPGAWHIVHAWFDGGNLFVSVDNAAPSVSAATTDQALTGVGPLSLGKSFGSTYFDGIVMESMIAPTDLGGAFRTGSGTYLQSRYAITAGFPTDAIGIARPGARPFGGVAARGPVRHLVSDQRPRLVTHQSFLARGIATPSAVGPVGGVAAVGPRRHMRPTAPAFEVTQQPFVARGIDRPVRPVNARGGGPTRRFPQTQAFLDLTLVTGVSIVLSGVNSRLASGSVLVVPGDVAVAPSGVRSDAVPGSIVLPVGGLVLALSGARAGSRLGAVSAASFYTMAPAGVATDARASAGLLTTSYTVALTGVRGKARLGAAAVAPGSVALVLAGTRARAPGSAGSLSTFVTFAPSGVAADARLGRIVQTGTYALSLAGVRSRSGSGRVTVVPSGVAVALSGLAARARSGAIVATAGAPGASLVALSGLRAEGVGGAISFTTAATIAPIGAYVDGRASPGAVTTSVVVSLSGARARTTAGRIITITAATIALSGALADARSGRATVGGFYALALSGAQGEARAGRAQLTTAVAIAPAGVASDARQGAATVTTAFTMALAGAPTEGRLGRGVVLMLAGRFLGLSGIRAEGQLGWSPVFIPGDAFGKVRDLPTIRFALQHVTSVDFESTDFRTTRPRVDTDVTTSMVTGDAPGTRMRTAMSNYPYNIGDDVTLTNALYNRANALVDATTITLTVKPPTGAAITPTVTHTAVGKYEAIVDATEAGTWRYRWTSTGTAKGVEEGFFVVHENTF